MRVSQRLDYALRAAIELAQLPEGKYEAGAEIAQRLGLPTRFVEQQLSLLGKHAVVVCRRGSGGGCALARAASEITVADVVAALEGSCLDVPAVRGSAASELWGRLAEEVEAALGRTTLAELAERQRALNAETAPMYYI